MVLSYLVEVLAAADRHTKFGGRDGDRHNVVMHTNTRGGLYDAGGVTLVLSPFQGRSS